MAFQRLEAMRTPPRIAVHYGNALYRDGDYYGRDVNIASRVGARAAGAEVLVLAAATGLDGYDARPVLTDEQWSALIETAAPRPPQGEVIWYQSERL